MVITVTLVLPKGMTLIFPLQTLISAVCVFSAPALPLAYLWHPLVTQQAGDSAGHLQSVATSVTCVRDL